MRKSKSFSTSSTTTGGGKAAAMRVVVPLQGIVQGRGGLFLGSVIPCALFYFLQLYLKSREDGGGDSSEPPSPPSDTVTLFPDHSPTPSSSSSSSGMKRVQSRSLLSPRGSSGGLTHLSSRANTVIKLSDGPYYVGLKRVEEDPFDEVANPDGIIQLCLAENMLSWDLVQDWLASHARGSIMGQELSISGSAAYQPFDGLMELKTAVAGFMSQVMEKPPLSSPAQIELTAGANSAIEILVFTLADPGNAFLVPSPYCPGLDRIVQWRAGVEIIPVPCRSTDGFTLSITSLNRAFNLAKKRGLRVRGIILSNPSNPVGILYDSQTLYSLLDFAEQKNIHVISNELFITQGRENQDFVSVAEIINTEDFDRKWVHLVYGLSKDFSRMGFNIGVIYTHNENVLSATKKLARFSSVSVPTQRLVASMLSDVKFIWKNVGSRQERLQSAHVELVSELKKVGIECMTRTGGFYCWADMSQLIPSYSEKGELELWENLLTMAKIDALPGSSCHCIEPGWFGFCFAALRKKDIPLVVRRIQKVLKLCKLSA